MCEPWGSWSTPSRCSDRMSPPGTGRRSSTVDATPARASRCASVQPVSPPPTTRTRGSEPEVRDDTLARVPVLEVAEPLAEARQPRLVAARGRVAQHVEQLVLRPDERAG